MTEPFLLRPAEYAENLIIDAILAGRFAIGSSLPAERELAAQIGVTRPTLREALQRLARDGWLEIRQGKPTRVQDYWQEGSLGVLNAIATRPSSQPPDFIPNLLSARRILAPAYIAQAVERQPEACVSILELGLASLSFGSEGYAAFDWQLHHRFSILSGNPIFTLILNGFADLYQPMAVRYFQSLEARQHSLRFYTALLAAASEKNVHQAELITRKAMEISQVMWQKVVSDQPVAAASGQE